MSGSLLFCYFLCFFWMFRFWRVPRHLQLTLLSSVGVTLLGLWGQGTQKHAWWCLIHYLHLVQWCVRDDEWGVITRQREKGGRYQDRGSYRNTHTQNLSSGSCLQCHDIYFRPLVRSRAFNNSVKTCRLDWKHTRRSHMFLSVFLFVSSETHLICSQTCFLVQAFVHQVYCFKQRHSTIQSFTKISALTFFLVVKDLSSLLKSQVNE